MAAWSAAASVIAIMTAVYSSSGERGPQIDEEQIYEDHRDYTVKL